MSERFSQSRAGALVSAAAALFIGGTALNRGCNYQDHPRAQAPDLVSDKVRSFLQQILSPIRTPKEEAEICNEYLVDVEAINAMEDPEGFLEELELYQSCSKESSSEAKQLLVDSDAYAYRVKEHLMRCTPEGASFSLKYLEGCEEAEERWVYLLSDELEKNGIELSPKYFENFEYSEASRSWRAPGFGFELDSQDGSFHGSYQFNMKREADGSWSYFMDQTPEYYDDTIADAEPFVHAFSPGRITSAFIYEYNEVLARDASGRSSSGRIKAPHCCRALKGSNLGLFLQSGEGFVHSHFNTRSHGWAKGN